jgi:hypothetical protein
VIIPALPWFPIVAVICRVSNGFLTAIVATSLGNVNLTADDRLYIAFTRFVEEVGRGKQISVVGNRHGGHFLAGRFIQEL